MNMVYKPISILIKREHKNTVNQNNANSTVQRPYFSGAIMVDVSSVVLGVGSEI